MVIHIIPQSDNIVISNDILFDDKKMETTFLDDSTEVPMVLWKNTFNMRPLTLAAVKNGKSQSKSVHSPLNRMRSRTITSAAKSLDILRQNLQAAINKEIDIVIRKYLEIFFEPAVRNIKDNLGPGSVTEDLIKEVCKAMLEEAKQMYSGLSVTLTKSSPTSSSTSNVAEQVTPPRKRKVTTVNALPNEIVQNKREYIPLLKWDPTRVTKDTLFILSTSANKVLGLNTLRGKLNAKHPELVKYVVDQDDREWLNTARAPGLIPGAPHMYLFFLEDIEQLLYSDEYRYNKNLCLNELKGFLVPDFIQRKVRAYMTLMRTKYLPPVPMDDFSEQPRICEQPQIQTPQIQPQIQQQTLQPPIQQQIPQPQPPPAPIIFDPLPEPEPDPEPIQMSVGVGVECIPSLSSLNLFDPGLIEFDSSWFNLLEEDLTGD